MAALVLRFRLNPVKQAWECFQAGQLASEASDGIGKSVKRLVTAHSRTAPVKTAMGA